MIGKFVVIFKELPKPVKLSSALYVTCILGYNIYGTYSDSKTYLDKFREGKLEDLGISDYQKNHIKTDWDAVKYGANSRCLERLWDSIVWPITSIKNLVPAIVLMLNPPKKNE